MWAARSCSPCSSLAPPSRCPLPLRRRQHSALPLSPCGPWTPTCRAAAPAAQQLTRDDLERYIQQHGVQASFVHDDQKPLSDPDVVKSLVFMVHRATTPLLVVVPGSTTVDEKAVARHLQVARRRVRLATPDECLVHSGYSPGTVPPFGHPHPLRTLVDVAVTQQQEVFGGGGQPDMHVKVAVASLLHATQAEVGTFTERPAGSPPPCPKSPPSFAADAPSTSDLCALASALPLPWPAGSEAVRLVGVVAQKRRIAKLLQFVVLVPEDVPPPLPGAQASYLRRLWRHPLQHVPCEVQLIMGKTLERALGREGAAAWMDHVKVGSILSVTGRVQQHAPRPPSMPPQPPPEPAADPGGPCSSSGGGGGAVVPEATPAAVRPPVLDVVAHHVEVLFKNRDALDRARLRAARHGLGHATSVDQLVQLQRLGPSGFAASWPQPAPGSSGSSSDEDSLGDVACSSTSTSASSVTGTAPSVQGYASRSPAGAPHQAETSSSGGGGGRTESPFWQLSLGDSHVHLVVDLQGLLQMRACILPEAPAPAAAGPPATSAARASAQDSTWRQGGAAAEVDSNRLCCSDPAPPRQQHQHQQQQQQGPLLRGLPVVGLDAEWVPYSRQRGEPKTPVALLQVATRQEAFLVDLLSLLGSGRGPQAAAAAAATAAGSQQPVPAAATSAGSQQLTPAALALSDFLEALLASPSLVKLGFCLKNDLHRLQESYPWLPCFLHHHQGLPQACCFDLAEFIQDPQVAALCAPPTSAAAAGAPRGGGAAASLIIGRRAPAQPPSLSRVVEALLGKPLDKQQQRSDWAAGVLSRDQRRYAVNDAHVLTCVYDELLRRQAAAAAAAAEP